MLTEAARKIAEEAKRRRLWLYDPGYKKWYSPEDFMHIYHYVNAKDEFVETLQIRHPAEGIQAGFKRLMDTNSKLEAFTKQVMEYYQK